MGIRIQYTKHTFVKPNKPLSKSEYQALKNISFDVYKNNILTSIKQERIEFIEKYKPFYFAYVASFPLFFIGSIGVFTYGEYHKFQMAYSASQFMLSVGIIIFILSGLSGFSFQLKSHGTYQSDKKKFLIRHKKLIDKSVDYIQYETRFSSGYYI
jgi:hypothetical protein